MRFPLSVILAICLLFFLTSPPSALAGGNYVAAAYYFPGYHPTPQNNARLGRGWTEWDLVRAARPRFPGHSQPKQPLWGYLDESRPEVFSKKITAAADHGVDVLLFDWYWHNFGPFLERALEQGFLKAKNRDRVRFALMWANHDWIDIFPAKLNLPQKIIYPGAVTRETFDKATGHIVDRYFSQANYWKIDGRPYFSIYELMTLVRGLGGVPQTRRALDDFRARARAAGFAGIHLNAVAWGVKPEGLARDGNDLLKQLGFDSVTSYCWIHHTGLPKFPETPYPDWAQQAEKQWDIQTRQWKVPYHPNISMGWDSSPRTTQSDPWRPSGYPFGAAVQKNTPAEFQKSLQRLKIFLDARPDGQRIFTINAWNEWTEGSYLEPDVNHKFEYLEAIRKVMSSE